MTRVWLALPIAALLAAPAAAFTFFSLGATTGPGPGDPGIAADETLAVTFDAAPIAGVTDTTSGTVGLFTGTTPGVAAAPVGDTSVYQAVGTGGSSLFNFTTYGLTHPINSFSVYVGSVDTYNYIDVLDKNLNVIGTISGSQLPGNNGDQGASITNRRVYISAGPGESLGGLRFHSAGVAFEYDDIAVSAAKYGVPAGSVFPTLAAAPDPAMWMLMLGGFGVVGIAARRRRPALAA